MGRTSRMGAMRHRQRKVAQSELFRMFLLGVVAMLVPVGLTACTDTTPAYRYRMAVEVETPAGIKTGSSVIEVHTDVAGEYSIPTPGRVSTKVRGEATSVDLGNGEVLFALLRSPTDADWASRVMLLLAPEGGDFQATFDAMLQDRREKSLPRYFRDRGHIVNERAAPMLVTFSDVNDPTTVELVDPDDLTATFGEGFRLKRITVRITEDPVTTRIEERLGWLGQVRDMGFSRSDFPPSIPVGDFSGMFSKGF